MPRSRRARMVEAMLAVRGSRFLAPARPPARPRRGVGGRSRASRVALLDTRRNAGLRRSMSAGERSGVGGPQNSCWKQVPL